MKNNEIVRADLRKGSPVNSSAVYLPKRPFLHALERRITGQPETKKPHLRGFEGGLLGRGTL